jgi:acyl transferase domain-containing protein
MLPAADCAGSSEHAGAEYAIIAEHEDCLGLCQVSWEILAAEAKLGPREPEVGVYVGVQQQEYVGISGPHLLNTGPYSATGGALSVVAGRLSYSFGIKGMRRANMRACWTWK